MKSRIAVVLIFGLMVAPMAIGGESPATTQAAREALAASDDFKNGLGQWTTELESGGTVVARDGVLDIDTPAGCTVWFKQKFSGPIKIEYTATAISAGGKNDRVSDLNCFWMANDTRSPDDIFGTKRSGKFADYNQLLTYYVGLGGNTNTTTRFRRYIGDKEIRPLKPEHDLKGEENLLVANQPQKITLIADGSRIEFYRDDKRLFEL